MTRPQPSLLLVDACNKEARGVVGRRKANERDDWEIVNRKVPITPRAPSSRAHLTTRRLGTSRFKYYLHKETGRRDSPIWFSIGCFYFWSQGLVARTVHTRGQAQFEDTIPGPSPFNSWVKSPEPNFVPRN